MTTAGQFPRPGQLTHPDNIPYDMQTRFPWCMYKLVRKGAKYKKVPVSWRTDYSEIDPDDPLAQGTFAEVVGTMRANPDGWYGIGIVLTPETQALCFDADAPDAFELLDSMNEYARTYVETSISGVGRHYLWQGSLPHGRAAVIDKSRGIEVYAHNRFIAITGNVLPQGNGHIADGSGMFSQMFSNLPPPAEDVTLGVTTALGRSVGLSDRRVVGILAYRCKWAFDLLNSNANLADRSEQLMRIVGDLDKITGDPQQIWRIMSKSPMIAQNGYNAEKFHRRNLFDSWVADARDGRGCNTQALPNVTQVDDGEGPSVEHGRRVGADLIAIAAHRGGILPCVIGSGDLDIPLQTKFGKTTVDVEARSDELADQASLARVQVFKTATDAFEYLNRHFYIVTDYGGEAAVLSNGDLSAYKFPKFKEAYGYLKYLGKKGGTGKDFDDLVEKDACSSWLLSDTARRYLRVVYHPVGVNEPPSDHELRGLRNTWRGYGPRLLDTPPQGRLQDICPTIWRYLWQSVSTERSDVLVYIVNWLADAIQNPRRTEQRTAIILHSEDGGTGKTTFGQLAGALFHESHANVAISYDALSSRFTESLENRAIIACNEYFSLSTNMRGVNAQDVERMNGRLLDLIDSPTLVGEQKHRSARTINNYSRLILSSNKQVLLSNGAAKNHRRYMVVEASPVLKGNTEFWNKLYAVLGRVDGDGGELDRFFTFLAGIDLTGWLPQGAKPMTVELERQLEVGASDINRMLIDILDAGELIYVGEPRREVGKRLVADGHLGYFVPHKSLRMQVEYMIGTKLHMAQKLFGKEFVGRLALSSIDEIKERDSSGERTSMYGRWWPELDVARKVFEERCMNGTKVAWSNEQKRWEILQIPGKMGEKM